MPSPSAAVAALAMPPPRSNRTRAGTRRLLSTSLLILALLAAFVLSAARSTYAAGSVQTCTEAALEDALRAGGHVRFQCSGTILVTRTKFIAQDTTLDATGQHVILRGKGIDRIFAVNAGVNFKLLNLSVLDADGYLDGVTLLPATGYPPLPAPPSEWLLVGLGGLALVLVSLVAGMCTRPRLLRRWYL